MSRLRRALTWAVPDWLALAKMVVLLPVVRAALAVLPFRIVKQSLLELRVDPVAQPRDNAYLTRNAWAAAVVGRRLLGDKPCLTQALVVQWLLDRRGYEPELHIGVVKDEDGELKAHAWVEHDGRTIIGGWRSKHVYHSLKPLTSTTLDARLAARSERQGAL